MQAKDIMVSQVYKVKETDTVREFIEKCVNHRISGLPVVNERNEVVAYVSDGDVMRYIGKHKDIIVNSFYYVNVIKGDDLEFEERTKELLGRNVLTIANHKVVKVSWDEEVENIAALLGKKHIKKVPVERNGVLVGIISRGDVIRHSFSTIL